MYFHKIQHSYQRSPVQWTLWNPLSGHECLFNMTLRIRTVLIAVSDYKEFAWWFNAGWCSKHLVSTFYVEVKGANYYLSKSWLHIACEWRCMINAMIFLEKNCANRSNVKRLPLHSHNPQTMLVLHDDSLYCFLLIISHTAGSRHKKLSHDSCQQSPEKWTLPLSQGNGDFQRSDTMKYNFACDYDTFKLCCCDTHLTEKLIENASKL